MQEGWRGERCGKGRAGEALRCSKTEEGGGDGGLSVKNGSSATPLSSLSHIIHAPPAPCHLGDGLLWLVQRAMGMRAVGVGKQEGCVQAYGRYEGAALAARARACVGRCVLVA